MGEVPVASQFTAVFFTTEICCGSLLPNSRRCGVAMARLKFRTFLLVFHFHGSCIGKLSPDASCSSPVHIVRFTGHLTAL